MYPNYGNFQTPAYGGGLSFASSHNTPSRDSNPNEDNIVALLQHMDKEDLQRLLDSDDKVSDLVKDNTEFQQLKNEKVTAMATNKSMAEYNLSLKPRLDDKKSRLMHLNSEVRKQRTALHTSLAQLESLSSNQSTDTLLSLLESASLEAEDQSDELVSQLCNGQLDVDTFLREFVEKRKLYHLRKIKAEKLTEIVNKSYHTQPERAVPAYAQPLPQQPWAPGGSPYGYMPPGGQGYPSYGPR